MGAETELKLGLLPEYNAEVAGLPLLELPDQAESDRRQLENTYYDTLDHALGRARIALRIRRDGDTYIQTLKTASSSQAGLSVRGEWEWSRPEATLDTQVLREHLPVSLVEQGVLEALIPVFETNFERRLWWLGGEDEEGVWEVEVALDQGEVRAGERRSALCELELELKSGTADALFRSALEIARQVPVQVRDISKAQRGYALAGRPQPLPVVTPTYSEHEEATLVALISDCLRAWPVQLDAAIAGDDEALTAVCRTLDLLLVALESLPDVAEYCQVLISQYQRLRADLGRAHDWRLLAGMPERWQQAQRARGGELLAGLLHKTLPGQLALATGELLWQMADEVESDT